MDVLKWWKDNELGHAEILDLEKCRLCAQASNATPDSAFSNAGLIMSKKKQPMTADHVDSISFMGWHYKDNNWWKIAKRPK